MDPNESFSTEHLLEESSFKPIRPEEYASLGIDPADIVLGTFPSLKHPSQLQSRFGGNAYGLGLFEIYDRLDDDDVEFLQSIDLDNPEDIRKNFKRINQIYKRIGLLIRFSSLGRPYYLIPFHILSNTLAHIRSRVYQIGRVIEYHSKKKFLKEHSTIGIIGQQDDLVINEIILAFKDHEFIVIDSIDTLINLNITFDLILFTSDIYEIILFEKFSALSREMLSRRRLDQYAIYILAHVYRLLKDNGEIFIIAKYHTEKTNRTTEVTLRTLRELKKFALFTHIFKTKKRYKFNGSKSLINISDFQNYLSGLYIEQEVLDHLTKGKPIDEISVEEIETLPYFDFEFAEPALLRNQAKNWERTVSIFFDKIFLKPLVPDYVAEDWAERFSCKDYAPDYLINYLGQKKVIEPEIAKIVEEVSESRLIGCQTELLADYRDSFEYVLRTLRVLDKLKKGKYKGSPQIYIDRLRQPLENKARRHPALNDALKLIQKINRLKKIREYLNPDGIEGSRTRVLKNLPYLRFFGFSHHELREIALIVLSHSAMGRVISGKMNEKALKPLSDLARPLEPKQAVNLLRYCRLMTMAETEAARQSPMPSEQLLELFELYEYTVRIVTNRELDWDRLLDEKITSMGGIKSKIVRKSLKMMNHFEFMENWQELCHKGPMEKEVLADYDPKRTLRIENAIQFVETLEEFESAYLKSDPIQAPEFYRKFFGIEFHGTGHLFQRMESRLVYILLWISVHITRNEIVNFNPILADLETADAEKRVRRVEKEVRTINTQYLSPAFLRQFSRQLYLAKTSFVIGTGFQFRVNERFHSLEISYIDIERDTRELQVLAAQLEGSYLSNIPLEELEALDALFSNIESFCQSHQRITEQNETQALQLPARQRRWFSRAEELKENLRSNFLKNIFKPDEVYTNLDLLHQYAPHLLAFVLPELTALEKADLSGHIYLKSPILHYIIATTKKLQALFTHQKEAFHDVSVLHKLAKKEFGPMATGIIGTSEPQIEELERTVARIGENRPVFRALVKAFIMQDIGRIPELREKYHGLINPGDLGDAGAYILSHEPLDQRYGMDTEELNALIFLVRHHSLLHHILRGEFSFLAIRHVLQTGDPLIFDAFFVLSFIMLSAIREDLLLEDLADWMFRTRTLCHEILDGKTTLSQAVEERFALRGGIFFALEEYQQTGLTEETTPWDYLESTRWEKLPKTKRVSAGKMIFSVERILRLRGIRYVEFIDIANLVLKTPLEYIYKRHKFTSIGYATFERESFEALRIYNTLQTLPESLRHFLLNHLVDDEIRIFWYERVSNFLSYDNQIKLLTLALLVAKRAFPQKKPLFLNFYPVSRTIDKRYEALNDYLHSISIEKIWNDRQGLERLLTSKTDLILRKQEFPNTLSVDFRDQLDTEEKIAYMQSIDKIDQLKDYFHYSLRSLRRYPFQTDDYELSLERSYEKRLTEITDMLVHQADRQMTLCHDFGEMHAIFRDLADRSWEIGLLEEQKQRLNDLYELRKDNLRREKLTEIENILLTIHNPEDLVDYWNSIKSFLKKNRDFIGKEFEYLIARKFDQALGSMPSSNEP
ncbi:conserved hypothetical protein [uncultured Desulfatiglans sp.]|nr:conserved hypothetical protein [uncultured Desulfatiglans sp.]